MKSYFYDNIISKNPTIETIVIVNHAVEDVEDFLLSLDKNIGISLWIPKNSSYKREFVESIKDKLPVMSIRKELIHSDFFLDELEKIIVNKNFGIIDVGGYFAECLEELNIRFGTNLKGIVEDTENGLNKYAAAMKILEEKQIVLKFPIISVARSPLKSSEDYVVGRDICLKTEIYFSKRRKNVFASNVVVLGFGKIGRSVAEAFRRQGAYVSVRDINPIRQALAVNYGYKMANEEYMEYANIVICATGNKSISIDDIQRIKYGRCIYFISVTSPDDEYKDYYKEIASSGDLIFQDRVVINNHDGKAVFVHDGLAINFQETKPILSKSIQLVMAEMCRAISTLNRYPNNKISEVSDVERKQIAGYWLSTI